MAFERGADKRLASQGDAALPMSELVRQGRLFLRRNRGIILTTTLALALVAAVQTGSTPRLYDSTAQLLVQRPQASPIEQTPFGSVAGDAVYVEGQIHVIASPVVLAEVVTRLGLDRDRAFLSPDLSFFGRLRAAVFGKGGSNTPPQTVALRRLDAALSVTREAESNMVSITVRADGPTRAAQIANTVADVYAENRQAARLDEARQVAGWVEGRALDLQDQLRAAEDAVADFRAANRLMTDATGATLSEQQLFDLNAEVIRIRSQLVERRATLTQADLLLAKGGDLAELPQVQASQIMTALRVDLMSLQRQESDLGVALGEDALRLAAVRAGIADLERQIAAEAGRIVGGLRHEVAVLEAREALLVASIAEASGQSGRDNRLAVELRQLERVADSYRALYERYLTGGGLAEESSSFVTTGVEVVSRALPPQAPSYPPSKVIVVLAALLGAGLGAALAMLREWTRETFQTLAQVESELGLPVLACIPHGDPRMDVMDQVIDQPSAPFSEAVRLLRHTLGGNETSRGRVVMLTSARGGEGKSYLAAALAASANATGKSVLLVDADFRGAGLTARFTADKDAGLSDLLSDPAIGYDLGQAPAPRLDLLPRGKASVDSADLFGSRAMRDFLDEAREDYDLVILDAPPVANLADATILAALADATALVLRWGETPRAVAHAALARLGRPVDGVVVNAFDARSVVLYGESVEAYYGGQDTAPATRPGGGRTLYRTVGRLT